MSSEQEYWIEKVVARIAELETRVKKLKKALTAAAEIICEEWCGGYHAQMTHSQMCKDANELLSPSVAPPKVENQLTLPFDSEGTYL
jgi:hypothetical protein